MASDLRSAKMFFVLRLDALAVGGSCLPGAVWRQCGHSGLGN